MPNVIIDPSESNNYDAVAVPSVVVGVTPVQALGADMNRIFVSVSLLTADNLTVPVYAQVGYMMGATFVPLSTVCQGVRTAYLGLEDFGPAIKFPLFVVASIAATVVALYATTLAHR